MSGNLLPASQFKDASGSQAEKFSGSNGIHEWFGLFETCCHEKMLVPRAPALEGVRGF